MGRRNVDQQSQNVSLYGHGRSRFSDQPYHPGEPRKLLSGIDLTNGFANRYLWIASRRTKLLLFGGYPDPEMVREYEARLQSAAETAKTIERMSWSREVMAIWEQHYPVLTAQRPGALGHVVDRAAPHAVRLAVITALINQRSAIEPEHLLAALAIVAYSERSAAYILGERLGDRDEEAILAYIRAKRTGASRAEIRRDVFHDNKPAVYVAEKLASLLSQGLIGCEQQPTAGRPREVWLPVSIST